MGIIKNRWDFCSFFCHPRCCRGLKCHGITLAFGLVTLCEYYKRSWWWHRAGFGNEAKSITKATRPFSINKIGWRLLSDGLLDSLVMEVSDIWREAFHFVKHFSHFPLHALSWWFVMNVSSFGWLYKQRRKCHDADGSEADWAERCSCV